MKRAKNCYWDVTIFNETQRVEARTVGCAVRRAYRILADLFRRRQVPDKFGRIKQFPPIKSNRDGGWDDVEFEKVHKFSSPRYVA